MPGSIYLAYLTGPTGNGLVMFFIGEGIISGADIGGIRYDGDYVLGPAGRSLVGTLRYAVPPNTALISGHTAGAEALELSMTFEIPLEFEKEQFVRLNSPLGPINAKFVKLRDLP